jgi:transposase
MTNHHDNNIKKWIHRYNQQGIDGIISKKHNHKQQKFTYEVEKKMETYHLQIQEKIMAWDFLLGHYVYWQAFLCMT